LFTVGQRGVNVIAVDSGSELHVWAAFDHSSFQDGAETLVAETGKLMPKLRIIKKDKTTAIRMERSWLLFKKIVARIRIFIIIKRFRYLTGAPLDNTDIKSTDRKENI